jgi:hypothetical protein
MQWHDRQRTDGNDDGLAGRGAQICVSGADRAVDTATGRVIDERIDAVPIETPGVSGEVWHWTGPVLGGGGRNLECVGPRLVVYRVACFAPSPHGIKDDLY